MATAVATPTPAMPTTDPSNSTASPPPRRRFSLWSAFPLYVWRDGHGHAHGQDANAAASASPPAVPTLYVPRGAAASTSSSSSTSWCSSDVSALRTQVEFGLRRVQPFKTVQLDQDEWWGGGGGGGGASSSVFLTVPHRGGALRLVDAASIPTWVETIAPWDHERAEDNDNGDEKRLSSSPYPSDDAAQEAKMWTTLVETALTAAVLLIQLEHTSSSSSRQRPLFSALLSRYTSSQRTNALAQRIATLAGSSTSSASLARWTGWLPGWTSSLSWAGVRSGSGGSQAGTDEKSNPDGGYVSWPDAERFDVDAIVNEGCEAIDAVAERFQQQGQDAQKAWFLDASSPTHLDASLFTLLHYTLSSSSSSSASLPPSSPSPSPSHRLRSAILAHPHLVAWTQRVYGEYIQQHEAQWRAARNKG